MSALVDRRRLREEAFQDVVADRVVLLVKRGMRDAGHHGELLVGVGQPLEELQEVGKARDAVVLAAHDEGRRRDFLGIADRQIGAHVDIGAGWHGVVELEDGVGERLDDDIIGGAGMVARLALDAMVWTGEGSPTLAERGKRLPEFRAKNRRPIDRKFVRSIFERDHPGTADDVVIEAFADAILKLDDSVPTGTYVDMCANLPVCDPAQITVPTLIMRGEYDGIASFADLVKFFERLPNPDKQFAVMPGIAHASFHQKNYAICYHILESFFSQPAPIYKGGH